MFVRWKRRRRNTEPPADWPRWRHEPSERAKKEGDSLDAVIVENRRDGKKVRQRVICYLGTVHEKTAGETLDRFRFWRYTAKKLEQLELKKNVRARLEAQLSAVIPRMSESELERYEAEGRARFNQLMNRG